MEWPTRRFIFSHLNSSDGLDEFFGVVHLTTDGLHGLKGDMYRIVALDRDHTWVLPVGFLVTLPELLVGSGGVSIVIVERRVYAKRQIAHLG